MIVYFLFLLQISTANSLAESFLIEGKKINFHFNKDIRLISSEKCDPTPKKDGCKNFEFLKNLTTAGIDRKQSGGVSVGVEICKTVLRGTLVLGTDENNNENSFCKLEKNLYIDNGSLLYIAEKNDGIVYGKRRILPKK